MAWAYREMVERFTMQIGILYQMLRRISIQNTFLRCVLQDVRDDNLISICEDDVQIENALKYVLWNILDD